MNVFGNYARYYNLLYQDKDYKAEAEYINGLIQEYLPGSRSILDLGCGSGKHAIELAAKGYTITGVDKSEKMVSAAHVATQTHSPKQAPPLFVCADIRSLRLDRLFDVVISLFHVMSYQTTNEDLQKAIETAASHLKEGGIFIFDSWYGPGVLTDPPSVRIKRVEDKDIIVTRIAEPKMHFHENIVVVDYHMFIRDKHTQLVEEIQEKHTMRYLFLPEVKGLLESKGFELSAFMEFMRKGPPQNGAWNALFIGRKK